MRFFSYKMTHDSGFAPNPYGFSLTLATCKPAIRRCKKVGDWIAGFTSITLNGDAIGEEKLVYLMHVVEKLTLAEYFDDSRFQDKIPNFAARGPIAKTGDNIYRPNGPNANEWSHFEQLPNPNHWNLHKNEPNHFDWKRDVSGKHVLIAGEFYYFGRDAISIPGDIRPQIPRAQSAHGKLTDNQTAEQCIEYIRQHYSVGRNGNPHRWPQATASCGSSCA